MGGDESNEHGDVASVVHCGPECGDWRNGARVFGRVIAWKGRPLSVGTSRHEE